ncbi:restriction endonuclease subunit S [Flavobacterium johnsoniae]|uniref:restriction endonuclease subunit S n=1 Tax=Flavobacterium johnsoniae TaxID=986 RepID=UPI003D962A90
MKGLEVSEILISNLEYSGRIDAEYYKPSFIKFENLIKNKGGQLLSDKAQFLIGPFGSAFTVDNYVEERKYRYIRGKDVKPLKLMNDDNVYMSKEHFEGLSRYALKENDIMVSVVGTIGNAAIIQNEDLPAVFSCKSTVIRTSEINPKYLLTYLNCKYGKDLLLRKERGAIQKGLNLDDLKTLDVLLASITFQSIIEKLFETSNLNLNLCQQKHIEAEKLLLQTLGLQHFQPSMEAVNIKSFKESFVITGRLDAEFYQPKYEEIEKALKKNNKYDLLSNLLVKIDTGEYSPEYFSNGEKNGLTFYIRSTNIKNGQIEKDANFYVEKNNFNKIARTGNIVTARVGTIGIFGEIREQIDGSIYSDNVLCFQLPDSFNPSVYTLLFNSKIYFELIDRLARGSVQQRLNQETLKDLLIPIIKHEPQQQIAVLIQESFALKAKSEKLLEVAKRAVEIAIEENEEAAITFIKKNS